jgi:DNA-binding NarL/FixJ family response regulator
MLLLAVGLQTTGVAHALPVAEHTVRTHVKQALR